ncbi:MAG: site-specific integrase [Lachnospiraceae bacterium]|nr:site-specific integrase [Lachnospiraceae bacterium]
MAGKRKDSNGILLNKGERQMPDGRYRYRYTDNQGGQHDVYSWTLRPEDKAPDGRKPGMSLREQEKQIQKDLLDGVKSWEGSITLNTLILEYFERQKPYWADSTWNGYKCAYKKHIKPSIGRKKAVNITSDDISRFYDSLIHDESEPLKTGSIAQINRIIKPSLQLAVRKRIIRNNPALGCYGELTRKNPESRPEQRHALETKQLNELLNHVAEVSPQYYNLFYVMAWTGCRINEAAALTWYDIDFQKEVIHVRRSLQYQPDEDGKLIHKLKAPKTEKGFRDIPMLADVKQILRLMQGNQKIVAFREPDNLTLDDLSVFVFKNSRGHLLTTYSVNAILQRVVASYNREHEEKLPDVSSHTLRHTFCCWLCEHVEGQNSADDLKYIQKIMGHSDISTTLNIYSECRKANSSTKDEALKRIAAQS